MKITILQGAFFPVPPLMGGAVEKIWHALGREFAARGHEVTQVSRRHPDLPDEELIEGVRHVRVQGYDTPANPVLLKLMDLLYTLRACRVLPEADILVTNSFWAPLLIRTPANGAMYVHVARHPKGQIRLYRHAARLQAVSEAVRAAILDEVPDLCGKVCSIPNPLPNPAMISNAQLERRDELLFVGRIHPEKGIHLLIEAFVRLRSQIKKTWRVKIVGPWSIAEGGGGLRYLAKLRKLAAPVIDRVEFPGPVYDPKELAAHYRSASLFVFPSLAEHGESFGLAPLEAMSHGCPALVSGLPCFREFMDQRLHDFVFNHRQMDPTVALAAQIKALIQQPDRLSIAGSHGIQIAKQFALGRIADRYLDDFACLLSPTMRIPPSKGDPAALQKAVSLENRLPMSK